jgi:hypothetical protein
MRKPHTEHHNYDRSKNKWHTGLALDKGNFVCPNDMNDEGLCHE